MYIPYGDYALAIAPYVRQIREDINKSPEKKVIYSIQDIAKMMGPKFEKRQPSRIYKGLLFVLFYDDIFVEQSTKIDKIDTAEHLLIMRPTTEKDTLPPDLANIPRILKPLDESFSRLFINFITEFSIIVEELKIRPFTASETKKLMILNGKHIFFDRWMVQGIYKNRLYFIENFFCYMYLSNKFNPVSNILYIDVEYENEFRNLQQFIKSTYPFNKISKKELTDVNKIDIELSIYCDIYVGKPENFPEIEEVEIQTQYISDIIDNGLWMDLVSSIYDLSNSIIEEQEDPEFEFAYSERMARNIGNANYLILLIDILKSEEYPIKDYILEGKELVVNLTNAVEVRLDKRLGIENNNIVQYEAMKKFIEDTFPLNKIVTQEIDYEYGKIILKDFLKGISITPKPEMFKKIIHHIELEEFKLLINDVLKENKDAKIYINLTKENIESILEYDQLLPRLYIEDINRYILKTINFNVTITDNFDIELILSSPTLTTKSIATKRILLDVDIEIYKDTLRDIIYTNPNTIIGDIIFDSCDDLRNILYAIPTDIGINYSFQIDILQKDQDIIRDLYKTVDITKFKEDDPILKAAIGSIEISETFTPKALISSGISQTFGVEILDHTSEEKYCILTFHIGKICRE